MNRLIQDIDSLPAFPAFPEPQLQNSKVDPRVKKAIEHAEGKLKKVMNTKAICKRTDEGVVALMFDNQEGKYFSNTCPMSLDFLKASEAEDPSQRFKLVAYIEVRNDERGYPKPGQQVH